jgi:hypothetical protein
MPAPLPRGSFTYDPVSGRYRSTANGRYVSRATVRAELDASIDAANRRVKAISEQLRLGRINLGEWERVMAAEIRNATLSSTALARGGWDFVTKADERAASRQIREQYAYLRDFGRDIASGKQRLHGIFLRRAMLYMGAARSYYEDLQEGEMAKRGYDEFASERGKRDSCVDCVAQEALGFIPIGDPRHMPIGRRRCTKACGCRMKYRNSLTGVEAA